MDYAASRLTHLQIFAEPQFAECSEPKRTRHRDLSLVLAGVFNNTRTQIAPRERDFMASRCTEPPSKQDFVKRRSFEQGSALVDAAHIATQRLYCDVFKFWRGCRLRSCKRHRRCCGEPIACLLRGLPFVPPSQRLKAQNEVIAGGPRRVRPATHIEWCVRRTDLQTLVSWGLG